MSFKFNIGQLVVVIDKCVDDIYANCVGRIIERHTSFLYPDGGIRLIRYSKNDSATLYHWYTVKFAQDHNGSSLPIANFAEDELRRHVG